jgi:hypothetical protein
MNLNLARLLLLVVASPFGVSQTAYMHEHQDGVWSVLLFFILVTVFSVVTFRGRLTNSKLSICGLVLCPIITLGLCVFGLASTGGLGAAGD